MKYPQRHNNQTLEQKSETFLRRHLPQDWNVTRPNNDYGQDLNVEICENGLYKGLELIIQLKSSAASNQIDNCERQDFKVSTYNYLWNNLRVVMIIKYIDSEDEAYWVLLKDVKMPSDPEQKQFTIYLPRENRISTIDWNVITTYIRKVTNTKLIAARS